MYLDLTSFPRTTGACIPRVFVIVPGQRRLVERFAYSLKRGRFFFFFNFFSRLPKELFSTRKRIDTTRAHSRARVRYFGAYRNPLFTRTNSYGKTRLTRATRVTIISFR